MTIELETAERLKKLFRLGLDPAASPGEQANAGQLIIKQMRQHQLAVDDLLVLISRSSIEAFLQPANSSRDNRKRETDDPGRVIMPWGKWKGKTLGWIVTHDAHYFRWLAEKGSYGRYTYLREPVEELYYRYLRARSEENK